MHEIYKQTFEIFLKVCSALSNNYLNIKILIVSRTPIWVIFQNSVTYVHVIENPFHD